MISPRLRPLPMLTVAGLAERLQVSQKTIRRLIERAELRTHRVGRQLRIAEDDVAAFILMRRE